MVEISDTQQNNILNFINQFKNYSTTDDYKKDIRSREDREHFFSTISKEKLLGMNEFKFAEFISKLWSTLSWGNKSFHVDRVINDNGLEKVKNNLAKLLFDEENVIQNFDDVLISTKYLGPASITELLCCFFPHSCGIWNNITRDSLEILGFSKDLPLKKYQINSKDYQHLNNILIYISDELKKSGFSDSNLLFVDYFLIYVQSTHESVPESTSIQKSFTMRYFDHNEVRDFICYIGEFLGFKTEIDKSIAVGVRVDVVWEVQVASLGVINYIFEVHETEAIDSLILNLQKSKKSQTVQKIIVVADNDQLERIKKETVCLPNEFVRSMTFWEASDVTNTYYRLCEAFTSINKLELVKSDFSAI